MLYRTAGRETVVETVARGDESLTGEGDGNVTKNVADVMVQSAGGLELGLVPGEAGGGWRSDCDRSSVERRVGNTLARSGKRLRERRTGWQRQLRGRAAVTTI